jgi:hypothetical protein
VVLEMVVDYLYPLVVMVKVVVILNLVVVNQKVEDCRYLMALCRTAVVCQYLVMVMVVDFLNLVVVVNQMVEDYHLVQLALVASFDF